MDLDGGRSDSGLYAHDGCLEFFDVAAGAAALLTAGRYVHVVLTRDDSSTVVGYVDGAPQIAFADRQGLAAIGRDDEIRFLMDDQRTKGEEAGGAIARIRLYDGPLGPDQVRAACDELWGSPCGPTEEEYVLRADGICTAAAEGFVSMAAGLETAAPADRAAFEAIVAETSESVLAELLIVPQPLDRRALLEAYHDVLRRQIDLHQRIADALERERMSLASHLTDRVIDLTEEQDRLMPGLSNCPIPLEP